MIRWGKYKRVYQRYRCKACFSTFNDKIGTLFAYKHLSLQGWFWLIVLSLYGHLSWRRIGKILGVSEMTVFGYGKAMMEKVKIWQEEREEKLKGIVELDEAYVKAGLKGRNNQGKIKALGRKARKRGLKRRGRGNYDKDCVTVIAWCEREGRKILKMSPDLKGERLKGLVERLVERGSLLITDEYPVYKVLDEFYERESQSQ